jgi:hypothetical protein
MAQGAEKFNPVVSGLADDEAFSLASAKFFPQNLPARA